MPGEKYKQWHIPGTTTVAPAGGEVAIVALVPVECYVSTETTKKQQHIPATPAGARGKVATGALGAVEGYVSTETTNRQHSRTYMRLQPEERSPLQR